MDRLQGNQIDYMNILISYEYAAWDIAHRPVACRDVSIEDLSIPGHQPKGLFLKLLSELLAWSSIGFSRELHHPRSSFIGSDRTASDPRELRNTRTRRDSPLHPSIGTIVLISRYHMVTL